MKILWRALLFLLVLALLAGLAAALSTFTAIPWLSAAVQGLMARFAWLPLALSIALLACMAAGVLALVLIVSVPTGRNLFVSGQSAGKIEITRQSVESAATASLDDIPEIKRHHVHSRGSMRPGKLKLEVQAQLRDGDVNLVELGRTIQQHLACSLGETLAIEPKNIRVKLLPVYHEEHTKVPRVV